MDLNMYIREVPDFPKPGIAFKDITPLLLHPQATKETLRRLLAGVPGNIDKVVAMESRGFLFGMPLARELNCGFVPVRKPGKLPGKTIKQDFDLEYGSDTLEIHADAIASGDRVLIHDDVLATGGTAEATAKLIESLGGEVVQFNFLIELSALQGRKRLNGKQVHVLFDY
ncbi:adenine phosphoribosyltransferase [Robertkochia marina]|uniref:Adenine phosphoribosyltransferase n=1 Tax=Robertkochia marina TaxID=1227945 RepID=A0A4S3M0L3_9FLAO|nr:adenine phosphoribosyltransferase [Robertkochia marina]THD66537.1 adenine phosphoribosyltransferase [Robertkochia marina]TRZ45622.1 adenine phosphoribosyltransferase [Robertkochia marina]